VDVEIDLRDPYNCSLFPIDLFSGLEINRERFKAEARKR
jgi:hypothetical protein